MARSIAKISPITQLAKTLIYSPGPLLGSNEFAQTTGLFPIATRGNMVTPDPIHTLSPMLIGTENCVFLKRRSVGTGSFRFIRTVRGHPEGQSSCNISESK
ncbi:hypothetical protein A9A89_1708 [Bifidobacterium psychraerophilum DSM 22366]|uniref:Uncharacterized protein n=1 Tax=Bifidobacterium psychraerophilum TaxID=218140 RepID=A0A087CCV0_9BIFI|nr:hypothetical protein BPSY_1505 [Bifidobacterium psychraerophilum]PKA95443.1 hypothetical protein A9A89_1708 [Bifidobacterium psychraerophilum DSM 22366]